MKNEQNFNSNTTPKKKGRVIFKEYNQNQTVLLPQSIESLIPKTHPARIVNDIVDAIPISQFEKFYVGGGAPSFHPKMMTKIIIYCYINNIYSSRKIRDTLKENIFLMWLSANTPIDHMSINRFRTGIFKDMLKYIFIHIVEFLVDENILSLEEKVFIDGTKIEANANKYTFVWQKSISRYKQRIYERLEELWKYAEEISKGELGDLKISSGKELNSTNIENVLSKINTVLKVHEIDSKKKLKLNMQKKIMQHPY